MEAIFSSETSVDFQRATPRYIPEDSTLHNRCENLKSYISVLDFVGFMFCWVNVMVTKSCDDESKQVELKRPWVTYVTIVQGFRKITLRLKLSRTE
jgi:hypothetical protein